MSNTNDNLHNSGGFVTVAQAQKILNLSRATIYRRVVPRCRVLRISDRTLIYYDDLFRVNGADIRNMPVGTVLTAA